MTKWFLAFGTTAAVMLLVDLLWIGWLARPLYVQGIGHLMAARPNFGVAVAFYLVYASGLLVFALWPHAASPGLGRAAGAAALFGFFAYATYDLTNLATLKGLAVAPVADRHGLGQRVERPGGDCWQGRARPDGRCGLTSSRQVRQRTDFAVAAPYGRA